MPEETKVKKRRVTSKDFGRIEEFILNEFAKREGSTARKNHENVWRVLDNQIAMAPPGTSPRSGDPDEDWHSAIELGALADALEILAADVNRLAFPIDRVWFVPHVEIEPQLDEETGEPVINQKLQRTTNGVLRSFMAQQHADFGFRQRVKQAVKEALTHGGFAAEVAWDRMEKFMPGGRTMSLGAPVLNVHSMWNVFPDPSPSVYGTELFYRGSMIIRSYMPHHKVMARKDFIRKDQIPKQEAKPKDDVIKDVELLTYYGDISLPRKDGDMFLPNMKVILANKTLVFAEPNKLPYPNIIYSGYERDDLRDPYHTSPLVKRSPVQKLMTELVNRFVDSSEMKAEPPIVYDSYDTSLVADGGPKIQPGAKVPIKGGVANFKPIDVGDPSFMFDAFQALRQDLREGLGVDSVRSGVSEGNEPTATEILKREQKGELRSVDFLTVLDAQVLKPFLQMQHDLNLMNLETYPFFNNEINTPDFMRATKKDLPENVIFEIVGSKEVLGEEQRAGKFVIAMTNASQIPQIAERTDWDEMTQELFRFTGIKDPERFVVDAQAPTVTPEQVEEIQLQIQGLQQQLAQAQQQVAKDDVDKKVLQGTAQRLQNEIAVLEEREQALTAIRSAESRLKDEQHKLELLQARERNDGSQNS